MVGRYSHPFKDKKLPYDEPEDLTTRSTRTKDPEEALSR